MFVKYPSIENHYQEKWINRFLDKFGDDLVNSKFVITEKIHGANTQLIFTPGESEYSIGSRNQLTDKGFYNVGEVLDNMDLSFLQELADNSNYIIRVFGETFGPGIQKGVNYGGQKRLLFFDIMIGSCLCTYKQFFEYFEGHQELIVPVVGYCDNLVDALAFDTNFNSKLNDIKDNECEGIVIKPFDRIFISNVGSLFYVKKKNEKFKEKTKRKTKPKPEWSDTVNNLRNTFLAYVNKERLESVFSKFGRIEDRKDIGKYIGYFMKDATDTFKKEEDFDKIIEENDLTKEEIKYIMSVHKDVSEWIINEAI